MSLRFTYPARAIDEVLLHLKIDDGEWWHTTMTYDGSSELWTTQIFGYNQLSGKTLDYYIDAYNNAGNKDTSARAHFELIYSRVREGYLSCVVSSRRSARARRARAGV